MGGRDRDRVTPDDAGELPRPAAVPAQWEDVAADYDVAEQVEAVVDGLLGRRPTGRVTPA